MALVRKNFTDLLTITRASVKNVYQPVDDGFGNISYPLVEVAANERALAWNPITGAPLGISAEEARTNEFTYSNDFTNGVYTNINMDVQVGDTLIGKQFTKIVPTAVSSEHKLRCTSAASGNPKAVTIYAKADGYRYLVFDRSSGARNALFDLVDGTVQEPTIGVDGVTPSASIEHVGDGVYKCEYVQGAISVIDIVINNTATADAVAFVGDGVGGIQIYNFQSEDDALFGSSPIETEASTATRDADVVTLNSLVPWFNPSEFTMVFDVQADGFGDVNKWITTIYDAARANEISLLVNTSNQLRLTTENGGTADGAIQYTQNSVDGRLRIAISVTQSRIAMSSNGSVAASDTITGFSAVQTLMTLGSAPPLFSSNLGGTMSLVKAYPEALTDAQLQAESAI